MQHGLTVADYIAGVEGLAILRTFPFDPPHAAARGAELAAMLAPGQARSILDWPLRPVQYDVAEGYARWAPVYDGPNAAVEAEEPLVAAIARRLPTGRALDAACGTGRHAVRLAADGWDVIGVDATPAMLDVARAKGSAATFLDGRLEALPVDDASVDLVVCALALTHVADLAPVFAEFSRVLVPSGVVVTSDIHPFAVLTGAAAGFNPGLADEPETFTMHFVENQVKWHHTYVGAASAAGLGVSACHEPRLNDATLASFPTFSTLPDATRAAFGGLPWLLIWEFAKLS